MTEPLRTEGERLAKRVMALHGCSRSEAERLIELGYVQVNGVAVNDPARRVHNETVHITTTDIPEPLPFVNLLWHKPTGLALQADQPLTGLLPPSGELQPWHLKHLRCLTPLPATASGVAVFAQDPRLLRRLRDTVPELEQEWMLDVAGAVTAEQLDTLRAQADRLAQGRQHVQLKLSLNSQNGPRTRLRLAMKHGVPDRLQPWLYGAGLRLETQHRLRVGRLALGAVPTGGWRLLDSHERL